MSLRILGLIPARGGSKGVPRKNIADVHGRPLISYTIEYANQTDLITTTLVSTDDPEIQAVALRWGADCPSLRPAELAADDTPTLAVCEHELAVLGAHNQAYDAVCLLQPTSPYRDEDLVARAIDMLVTSAATCVVSVRPIPPECHPDWALLEADSPMATWANQSGPPPRRQDLRSAYRRDGALYLITTRTIQSGSLYGNRIAILPCEGPDINIDTPRDLELFRDLMRPSY